MTCRRTTRESDAAVAVPLDAREAEIVSTLIVTASYCVSCLALKSELALERVLAAFRGLEEQWREPLIDTGRCTVCHAVTTVYGLRLP